ncbi:MAG: glycosyltransferase family 4 protein [Jaaginema sp. PMC 1079.18]|nr:glycosyltransferase family 4 protein [Jaaginema sp. PMC 1080.18]MEC4851152.1 glycosyltransferase family 4 protein [Jaaginema sp. PMC 1079.18]MEC4866705.1 glycosyltransferase family 4 protein [Jaaginema sp. PMC 1078.18]
MIEKHLPKFLLIPFQRLKKSSVTPATSVPLQSRQKLLIATQFYPPDYAATGQLIAELATQLSQLGFRIRIFTAQPGYAFQKESAAQYEVTEETIIQRSRSSRFLPKRIRGRTINGLIFCVRTALHLIKFARRQDTLLLTTEPPYLPFLGYLAHLCFGLSYVCVLYDLYPDVAVELQVVNQNHILARFWDWCNRLTWKHAQGIIVLSSTMKNRVAAKNPAIADKIYAIPSWSDPIHIKPIDKRHNWFAQKHNFTDRFTILYSGNLGRCHDMETILATALDLKDDPVQFVFIGHGAKLQGCKDYVQQHQLNNCLFLPYQDKEVIPYSLTACDLSLVSISPGLEGLVAPSKLYGILAAARPVAAICEPHSYLRDLLKEARCGECFDNGDRVGLANYIRYLASQPQLGKALGRSGRRYLLRNCTPEIIAQEYLKVLTSQTPLP